jgi:hypothetical protein
MVLSPNKYQNALNHALEEYRNNSNANLRDTAAIFGLKKSTLHRHLYNPSTHANGHESKQRLSREQERWLAEWIKEEHQRGFAPTYMRVREMALTVLRFMEDDWPLGKDWHRSFLKRNPDVKSMIGTRLDNKRANGVSKKVLNEHFSRFKSKVSELKIVPSNIWNIDENGTSLSGTGNQRVIGDASKKKALLKDPTNREWATTLEGISAVGERIRPLTIFKGQTVQL